jgi:hypothetical protein
MKKFIIVAVYLAAFAGFGAALSGCGQAHLVAAKFTGYSTICISETNVQYVQGTSGLAPLIDQSGKPVACH